MLPNQATRSMGEAKLANGMTVYGMDGDKLGTLRNYDPQAGYLDVQKGWLFHKDFYIPLTAVQEVDEAGVTLRLTKANLDDVQYASPPAGSVVTSDSSLSGQQEPGEAPDTAERGTGF